MTQKEWDKKIKSDLKSGKIITVKQLIDESIAKGYYTREEYEKTYKEEMEENARLLRARTARKVRRERLKLGVTQDQLAKKLHTSKSFISEIENGKQNISLEYASKIASALNKEFVWEFK